MTSPAPGATVGHAVMSLVREHGIDTVFGIPGTHNLELYRPLRALGLRAVTTRHEQGAVFAADGWALTSGRPGVVITTSGPGLLNALSAAATAWAESRPMLILSPGPSRGAAGRRTGELHETKDAVGASDRVLAWSRRVDTAAEALAAVSDAFAFFRTERPGPVHIEVPLDLLAEESEDTRAVSPGAAAPDLPPEAMIRAAVAVLDAAARPLILCGGGARAARTAVRTIAERLGAPIVTTLNGKGVVDESHPLVIGSDVRMREIQQLFSDADAVLVVGSDIGDAELWGGSLEPGGPVVRVDVDAAQMTTTLTPRVALVGHAELVLPLIADALGVGAARAAWCDVAAIVRGAMTRVREAHPALAGIVDAVAGALPPDAVVAGDSSQVTYLATSTLWRTTQPDRLLYMPTYATLGYGLPAAVGAKIADPARAVVGLIGDGAFMFSLQEFATAVEQRLCLPIVCVDNGGYGEIRQNMLDAGLEPVGVDLVQPDWPGLARALGGEGFESDIESLPAALRAALQLDVPSIIHVTVASAHP